jgi:archaellum component FlaF (FlaF/FlaG flagellin family)
MDQSAIITLISTLVGDVASLIGSFGATYLSQRSADKQEARKRHQEKNEEIHETELSLYNGGTDEHQCTLPIHNHIKCLDGYRFSKAKAE